MVEGRRSGAAMVRRVLRRVPCALAVLGLTGLLTASGVLCARRAQELTGTGAVEQPGLASAYAQEADFALASGSGPSPSRPARIETNLTYTSLDASGDGSAVARVTWDDAWFFADEDAYNHELARTSSVLAALAYAESGYYQAREDHPPYMENALAALGFAGVSTESYRYRSKVVDEVLDLVTSDADGAAYTIARKHLDAGGGQSRDLIFVSARGSYGSEWLSNLDLSRNEDDDHGGYVRAAREICAEVEVWAGESRAAGAEVSVLLVGHSRGGAIANLVAAELDDVRARAGDPIASVYAYTFATPATTLAADARSDRYGNIFNIANPSDIMPYLPLEAWGYERYGVDLELPSVDDPGFDRLEGDMRAVYRDSVGVECAADSSDVLIARAVCDDIAAGVGSVEELLTPGGMLTAFRSLATHVDPVRILYSHYPSTYIAWMSVVDESQLGTGTN